MIIKAILLALLRLPIAQADRAPELKEEKARQLEQVAASVHRHSDGNLEVMAMTLALGWHESAYSLRITRGDCRGTKECDARKRKDGTIEYRGRGAFQLHKNGLGDQEWSALLGPDSIDAQAKEAVRRVRSAFATCKGEPDPVSSAIAQYAGLGCRGVAKLKDMRARIDSYYSIRRFIP